MCVSCTRESNTQYRNVIFGRFERSGVCALSSNNTIAESYLILHMGMHMMLRFSAFFSKSFTSALDLLSIKDKLASACSRAASAVTAISNALHSSFVSHFFSLDISVLKDKLTTSYGIAANAVTSTCSKLCSAVSVSSFGSTLSHYKDVALKKNCS